MQVIEAQRASILVPHDHLRIKHERKLSYHGGGESEASCAAVPVVISDG